MPGWPGMERFKGEIVHPQKWPEDLDYAGKRVVVIGSGATAVTLVPAMADKAAHVTMLQRSPTYMVSRPAKDAIANWLRAKLPDALAYWLTRWKNILLQMYFYNLARKKPEGAKQAPDRDGPGRARRRHRHGEAFHPALQSVGPAAVPAARRRHVQGDPRGQGLRRHRRDRDLYRDRHQAAFRRGTCRPTSSSPQPAS